MTDSNVFTNSMGERLMMTNDEACIGLHKDTRNLIQKNIANRGDKLARTKVEDELSKTPESRWT